MPLKVPVQNGASIKLRLMPDERSVQIDFDDATSKVLMEDEVQDLIEMLTLLRAEAAIHAALSGGERE